MEGEATANGEYIHQQYLEGIRASADPIDQRFRIVREIWNKPLGETTDADWDHYQRAASELMKTAPMTEVQCNSMDLVFSENVKRSRQMELERLLTYSPDSFQTLPEVRLAYAQAWAVYHVDMTQKRGWSQTLDSFARKISNDNQALTDDEKKTLFQIERETIEWITKSELKRSTMCLQ